MTLIAHKWEVEILKIPEEVKQVVKNIAQTLDDAYGSNRDAVKNLGGYALVVENQSDLKELADRHLDLESAIPEYVDPIPTDNGCEWLNALYLLSSDFSVSLILPITLATETILKHVEVNN